MQTLYNADGQVSQSIYARGIITQFNYDTQGRQSSVIYALGTPQQTTTNTTYDANGNVLDKSSVSSHCLRRLQGEHDRGILEKDGWDMAFE